MITVNVISCLLWSELMLPAAGFVGPIFAFTIQCHLKTTTYCYLSVNDIRFHLFQSYLSIILLALNQIYQNYSMRLKLIILWVLRKHNNNYIKTTAYCYHLVNVIRFHLSQSYHIERLLQYISVCLKTGIINIISMQL